MNSVETVCRPNPECWADPWSVLSGLGQMTHLCTLGPALRAPQGTGIFLAGKQ